MKGEFYTFCQAFSTGLVLFRGDSWVLGMGMGLPRVRIREKRLGRERALGQAWHGENVVEIDPRQRESERLDTLIHELLHLMEPEWSEERVVEVAGWLSRILWRQGYRRVRK
jgi:hypothetical protein